jgi:hypothetical protein
MNGERAGCGWSQKEYASILSVASSFSAGNGEERQYVQHRARETVVLGIHGIFERFSGQSVTSGPRWFSFLTEAQNIITVVTKVRDCILGT